MTGGSSNTADMPHCSMDWESREAPSHFLVAVVGLVSAQRSPSSKDGWRSRQGSEHSISSIPWWTCHRPRTCPISCTRLFRWPFTPKCPLLTATPPVGKKCENGTRHTILGMIDALYSHWHNNKMSGIIISTRIVILYQYVLLEASIFMITYHDINYHYLLCI